MADLNKIVEELSGLTVLEVAELVKSLEEKWGVSAAAPVAAVAVAAGGAGGATFARLHPGPAARTGSAQHVARRARGRSPRGGPVSGDGTPDPRDDRGTRLPPRRPDAGRAGQDVGGRRSRAAAADQPGTRLQYSFNRRFNLRAIFARLAYVVSRSSPQNHRLIRAAEVGC